MEPNQARTLLLSQHDRLRARFPELIELAERVVSGSASAAQLKERLNAFRDEFAAHNESEETLLEPLLRLDGTWGAPRIDRMIEEHAEEHRAFRRALSGPERGVAVCMEELLEDIEAHMMAEERTFLSPGVLRPATATAESKVLAGGERERLTTGTAGAALA